MQSVFLEKYEKLQEFLREQASRLRENFSAVKSV